jgi:hypothetical protein
MHSFLFFMATTKGRIIRVVMGIIFIVVGYSLHNEVGYGLIAFGLLPLTAGAFDACYLGPFFGLPFTGAKVRACSAAKSSRKV